MNELLPFISLSTLIVLLVHAALVGRWTGRVDQLLRQVERQLNELDKRVAWLEGRRVAKSDTLSDRSAAS